MVTSVRCLVFGVVEESAIVEIGSCQIIYYLESSLDGAGAICQEAVLLQVGFTTA